MNHRRLRQFVALILGMVFALGTSTSVVSATSMAVKLAVACDSGAVAGDKCDGCGDSGCGMTATGCAATMCTPLVAMMAQAMPMIGLGLQRLSLPARTALTGWPSSPDPHPPRARTLS